MNNISPAATPIGKVVEEENAKKAGTANSTIPPVNSISQYQDTLDSLDKGISGVKSKVGRSFLKFASKVTRGLVDKAATEIKKNEGISTPIASDPLPIRPNLQKPDFRAANAFREFSLSSLNEKKRTLNENEKNEEVNLQETKEISEEETEAVNTASKEHLDSLRAIVTAMTTQAKLYTRQSELFAENIRLTSEENEALMKEFQDNKDEAERKKNT